MEIANEAFIRALIRWNKISRYEKPGAWVRRVGIRLAVRAKKRRWRESGELEDQPSWSPDHDLHMDLRRAILKLPRQQRAAIVLHYYEDMPVVEVADALGCREATAKTYLHRGRENLKAALAPSW